MRIAILTFCLIQSFWAASAFTVRAPTMGQRPTLLTLSSDKPDDEEEGGLDLDLGEMFEMFDAADKDESFDDAIKKVKGN